MSPWHHTSCYSTRPSNCNGVIDRRCPNYRRSWQILNRQPPIAITQQRSATSLAIVPELLSKSAKEGNSLQASTSATMKWVHFLGSRGGYALAPLRGLNSPPNRPTPPAELDNPAIDLRDQL